MTHDELTRQLQNLPREAEPPAAVRTAVARAALRSANRRRRVYWQAAVAASIFVVAFLLGRWTGPRTADLAPQREFVLLLYGGAPGSSPDDRAREYAAWASTMRTEGRRVSGERLSDDAWTVGATSNPTLRGFFIIQARDEQDARALAEAHPHVRYGGGIVVRPVARAP